MFAKAHISKSTKKYKKLPPTFSILSESINLAVFESVYDAGRLWRPPKAGSMLFPPVNVV